MAVDHVQSLARRHVEHRDRAVDSTARNVLSVRALRRDASIIRAARASIALERACTHATYVSHAQEELGWRLLKGLDLLACVGAPHVDVAGFAARRNVTSLGVVARSNRQRPRFHCHSACARTQATQFE